VLTGGGGGGGGGAAAGIPPDGIVPIEVGGMNCPVVLVAITAGAVVRGCFIDEGVVGADIEEAEDGGVSEDAEIGTVEVGAIDCSLGSTTVTAGTVVGGGGEGKGIITVEVCAIDRPVGTDTLTTGAEVRGCPVDEGVVGAGIEKAEGGGTSEDAGLGGFISGRGTRFWISIATSDLC